MHERVLVCYGTRYGSTGEIAENIAEVLRSRGAEVEVVNLKKGRVHNLDAYDLVVVGSGIQMGRWTKEPLNLIRKNREALSHKKVAFFVSCLSVAKPEACEQAQRDYLDKIVSEFPEIRPISLGFFGGLIDPTRGNFMTKSIMKALVQSFVEEGEEPPEYVDLRDWNQIREWAEGLMPDPFSDS